MEYWDYYIVLENDLLACRRYVEFSASNFHTHSQEFMHLLFATCSEVEVVLKELCQQLGNKKAANMVDYRQTIEPHLALSTLGIRI